MSWPRWKLDEIELGDRVLVALEDEALHAEHARWVARWAAMTPAERCAELDAIAQHEADPMRRDENGNLL